MRTEMANAVKAAGDKAQYDVYVKRLLSQKLILANILVRTIDEFKGMQPEDAVSYIEGEPQVGVVPVEPGLTNAEKAEDAVQAQTGRMDTAGPAKAGKSGETGQRIIGLNTEHTEINEGLVRFDIIFYVRMRNGLSQIIVNIECQKDEPSAYQILNRAIFYVSRLISSQKERDFVNTNYDDIKQVFSIWICMNMGYNCMSHIHLTKDEMLRPHYWKGNLNLLNIVMIGITNDIPEREEDYELHRLIATLLSDKVKEQEKLEIIEQEYNIPIDRKFREEVTTMCNLSDGIEERAEERTEEKIILNMYENDFSLEQISLATKKSIEEIEKIIEKNGLVLA